MRYKRVLLVRMASQANKPPRPSQGIGYLAESLLRAGIEYDIFDMLLHRDSSDFRKKINQFNPDLIGFSMFTHCYKRNYSLITATKQLHPKADIVVGGPHVSTLKEQVLYECPEIDYGIAYEGELSLLDLCKGERDYKDIQCLIWRDNGKLNLNPRMGLVENLDELPFPTFTRFELNKYIQKEIPIFTSRGCPYECIFCTVGNVFGTHKIRYRSPKNILEEISYWVHRGYRTFCIDDDNFTFDNKRIYELCDELERARLGKLEFRLHNGVRADRVSKDLLKRMKSVGFNYIMIAAEGGNDKVIAALKKKESIMDIKNAIKWACEAGMMTQVSFVVGTPGETWEDIEDSFRLAREFPIWKADFLQLIPMPGTELYEWVEKNDFFIKPPEVYLNEYADFLAPVFATPELSYEERLKVTMLRDELNSELRRKAAYSKLARLGILGNLGARLFATGMFQYLYYNNRIMRRIADGLRMRLET